ncbi:MAG: dihydrolipoyl dehydrogenase [Clostridia bacterium]|nr:dihydrolipoyl dehydrogenase [Clostridia bacterium]
MKYDLIVIGGGPAGYLASERAAHARLSTLCIEKSNIGGVCLNEGCIPTKTLLYSAKLFDGAMHSEKYGVTAQGVSIDHTKVLARKNKVVKLLTSGIRSSLKSLGVTVATGEAVLVGHSDDAIRVRVDETEYEANDVLIATGSSAVVPPIDGLSGAIESGFACTNREILSLSEVPKRLVVIGGGVIGLEMASYFNSIGSEVTVVEMLDHIAGENDRELSAILQKNYERKGIRFLLNAKAQRVGDGEVLCSLGTEMLHIECDKVLLSIGRHANTAGIGLESVGVATERGAIITDSHMRTNVPHIYAAGDVNGKSMLAHTAYREAEVAVNNILGVSDEMHYDAVPAVIYTNPELASIGITEAMAESSGKPYRVVKLPMRYSGRYLAENEGGDGLFKLIVDAETQRVIGAHALCNYASEFIVSVAVMMEADMTLEQIKKVIFPHPTVCEIIREAIFQCDEQ